MTDTDIERATRAQPTITEADVERARRAHPMPSEAELARVPIPSTPRLDQLPVPANQGPVDLGAIAKGFESTLNRGALESALNTGPALIIGISFSLPEPTLARLVAQAEKAQAKLVIRGFVDGSLRQTVTRIQSLIGRRQVSIQIDPQVFDRFGIVSTPSFILLRAGAAPAPCSVGTCYPSDRYLLASGDVSTEYALEFFQRTAPTFAPDAAQFLARLRSQP